VLSLVSSRVDAEGNLPEEIARGVYERKAIIWVEVKLVLLEECLEMNRV
jgi:hypothetical protein